MTGPVHRLSIPNFDTAECATENPELWFAEDTLTPVREDIELARAICQSCSQQVKCLAWGLRNEDFGMWGGLTSNERRHLKAGKTERLTHIDKALLKGTNGHVRISKDLY